MEEEERRQEIVPLALPNASLSVSYEDGLRYAQGRLNMIGSGGLKPFCESQQLTYTTVVGLKNNTLKRKEPRFLQRLLRSLAVPTELFQYPPNSNIHRFMLTDAEALATFQQQLAYLTAHE